MGINGNIDFIPKMHMQNAVVEGYFIWKFKKEKMFWVELSEETDKRSIAYKIIYFRNNCIF